MEARDKRENCQPRAPRIVSLHSNDLWVMPSARIAGKTAFGPGRHDDVPAHPGGAALAAGSAAGRTGEIEFAKSGQCRNAAARKVGALHEGCPF